MEMKENRKVNKKLINNKLIFKIQSRRDPVSQKWGRGDSSKIFEKKFQ